MSLNNNTIDKFTTKRFLESSQLPEKYAKLIDDDSEFKIFCIENNEKGGLPPYSYLHATNDKYLRRMMLLYIWEREHYSSLWQSKICHNCNFKYKTIVKFKLKCPHCKAPFDFSSEKIDKWLNGERK